MMPALLHPRHLRSPTMVHCSPGKLQAGHTRAAAELPSSSLWSVLDLPPEPPAPPLLPPTSPWRTARHVSDDSDGATTVASQCSSDDQEMDLLAFFFLDEPQETPSWESPLKRSAPCPSSRHPSSSSQPSPSSDEGRNQPSESPRKKTPYASDEALEAACTNLLSRLPYDGIRCIVSFLPLMDVVTLSSCCRDLAQKVSVERVKQIKGGFRDPLLVLEKLPLFHRLKVLDLDSAKFGAQGAFRLAFHLVNLHHLKVLKLGGNYMGVLGIRALSTAFLSPDLTAQVLHLDLSDNEISRDGAESIAGALHHSPALQSLETLNLNGNNLGMKGAALLAKAFSALACKELKHLHLARNGFFGLEAVKKLAAAWDAGALTELVTLDLHSTCLFSAGARELARALLRCKFKLSHLNLSGTSINGRGCDDVLEALNGQVTPHALQSLDLSFNRCLGRQGAVEVAAMLQGPSGKSIRVLDLAGINIQDGARALAQALGSCSELVELVLSDNHLDGAPLVMEALEHCPTIQTLKLANATLCNLSVAKLARVFDKGGLPNLTYLDLSGTQVNLVPLCHALGSQLIHLNLSKTKIGPLGARTLGARLGTMQNLEDLDLSSCGLNSQGVKDLMPSLPSSLVSLKISSNSIDHVGGEAVATRLQDCRQGPRRRGLPSLRVLDLSDNYITARAAVVIANSLILGACPKLEELNLASNAIGDDGLAAFCEVWGAGWGRYLRQLDLSWNSISACGASRLAHALKTECPRLRCVNLFWNFIGDAGACALAEALEVRVSGSLRTLECAENGIGAEGAVSLAKILADPKYGKMERLVLSHNPLGPAAVKEVMRAFSNGSCPTYLHLQNTGMGHVDVRKLAAALRSQGCEIVL